MMPGVRWGARADVMLFSSFWACPLARSYDSVLHAIADRP